MASYTICRPQLRSPFDRPRFTGSAVLLAPYASALAWEKHFASTVGIGDAEGWRGDELRFGRDDAELRSLKLLVPKSTLGAWPEQVNAVSTDRCVLRDIAPGRRWQLCMSSERGLLCLQPSDAMTSVRVADQLTLFVNDSAELCGWHLAHPAAALAAGYDPCPAYTTDAAALSNELVAYLGLAHDHAFLERLMSRDEAARARVQALAREVAALGDDTPQKRVLHDLVNELLDI